MPVAPPTSRMTNAAAAGMRAAIRLAGGKEVCLVCGLDDRGVIHSARVGARGGVGPVPPLPRIARPGEKPVPKQPSRELSPSVPDPGLAAALAGRGAEIRTLQTAR